MSWRKVNLGDLVENFSIRAKEVGGANNLEFFGVSNEDGIIKTKYAAEEKAEDYKIIEKECFAYNPYRINVGSIGMVQENTRGLISPAYVVFKPKPKKIVPELLLKFLKSEEGLRQIKFYARGTVRQALRFEDLCKIELSLPNYDEQIIFFDKLREHQEKSDLLKNELVNQLIILSYLRQQILQDAVQGKLVPQDPKDEPGTVLLEKIKAEKEKLIKKGKLKKQKLLPLFKKEEIPFDIPKNWAWSRFCDIAIIESNLVSPFDYPNMPHVAPDNILKHRGKLLIVNTVLEDSVKSANHYFFAGQLVYSKVRPQLNKVVEVDFEGLCSADMYPIMPLINRKFLLYTMLAEYFLNEVNKFDNRVKMPKINQNQLSKIPLPVPPLDEQIRIAKKIETLLNMCDDLEKEIKQNQKHSQQLLQSALKEALEPKVN